MNIILCGYHWSGCEALNYLLKKKNKVFVYTHKSRYFEPDLEEYCKDKKVKFSLKKISKSNLPFIPDLIISISYKYKIPDNVISISKFKPFNLHPSILPKYRGCSSITWAMVNGEKEVGFTYHYIENKFDSGNIILQKKMIVNSFDFQMTLYYRVMFESLKYIGDVIKLVKNNFKGRKQLGNGKYFKRGAPYDGKISSDWSNLKKKRFIKAMIFPPLPLAKYKNNFIKNFKEIKK